MEETGCEVICGAPTTLAVKGQVKMKVKMKVKLMNEGLCLSCWPFEPHQMLHYNLNRLEFVLHVFPDCTMPSLLLLPLL